MEAMIASLIAGVATGIIKVLEASGQKVDLASVMAAAAAAAGADMAEYQAQLDRQKALFPKG